MNPLMLIYKLLTRSVTPQPASGFAPTDPESFKALNRGVQDPSTSGDIVRSLMQGRGGQSLPLRSDRSLPQQAAVQINPNPAGQFPVRFNPGLQQDSLTQSLAHEGLHPILRALGLPAATPGGPGDEQQHRVIGLVTGEDRFGGRMANPPVEFEDPAPADEFVAGQVLDMLFGGGQIQRLPQ